MSSIFNLAIVARSSFCMNCRAGIQPYREPSSTIDVYIRSISDALVSS